MKLNASHIERLRKYLFSKSEEDSSAIEGVELLSFFQDLKQAFNNIDDKSVATLIKNTGNDDHVNDLVQLQQDYYSQLACLYVSGTLNSDIEILVKTKHPAFLNEIAFQKELETAFKLSERTNLKNKFQQIDDESDINTKEISAAFKLEERKRLKEQFREMDNEADIKETTESKIVAFNWKRFAIAASLAGVILTITFLFLNKTKKQPDLADTGSNNQRVSDSILNRAGKQVEINNVLNNTEVAFTEVKDTVVKEISFGFADKPEIAIIQLHDLGNDIARIDQVLNDIKSIGGFEKTADSLRAKKVSIEKLGNSYRFYNDTLSVYLPVKKVVKVLKIKAAYFIKVGSDIYYCKESSSYLTLKPADKVIVEKIKGIIN